MTGHSDRTNPAGLRGQRPGHSQLPLAEATVGSAQGQNGEEGLGTTLINAGLQVQTERE